MKDDEYIEMVMLAKKIGRRIIPVVEKFTELELVAKHAEQVGVKPIIGIRVKLASRGSGRWKSSGGYRSKFGLTVSEALKALEFLKEREMPLKSILMPTRVPITQGALDGHERQIRTARIKVIMPSINSQLEPGSGRRRNESANSRMASANK